MKTPRQAHPLDYLFVLRPALMPPVWTIFLLGYALAAASLPAAIDRDLLLTFALLFPLVGAVYLLNQHCDVETDRLNRKLHFLPLGLITARAARICYVLLNLVALALAAFVSLRILLLAAVGLILGMAYSVEPWRWKDRSYPALFANAAAHGSVVFLFGWFAAGGSFAEGLANSLPYFFAVGSIYLLTTLPDAPGDRATGKHTLAVVLGPKRAARWALGWYWAGVLVAVYTLDLLFLLAALPLAYRFVRVAAAPERALATVRWGVGLLSLAACIYFPWYLALLGLGFWATRRYYRWRFDLVYP